MKKMMVAFIAMAMCANVMAQEVNEQKQEPKPVDKEEMAQKRTDFMVERYGLNEEQAAKLLELNKAHVDKQRPMRRDLRRPPMKKFEGKPLEEKEIVPEEMEKAPEKMEKVPEKMEKAELKDKPALKDMKPGLRDEMKKEREAYENELQKIMTEEQFSAYKKDSEKRHHGPRGGFRGHRPQR